jgi:hypothetical protein
MFNWCIFPVLVSCTKKKSGNRILRVDEGLDQRRGVRFRAGHLGDADVRRVAEVPGIDVTKLHFSRKLFYVFSPSNFGQVSTQKQQTSICMNLSYYNV